MTMTREGLLGEIKIGRNFVDAEVGKPVCALTVTVRSVKQGVQVYQMKSTIEPLASIEGVKQEMRKVGKKVIEWTAEVLP